MINYFSKKNVELTASFKSFKKSATQSKVRFEMNERDFYPCMDDNQKQTDFDAHYIYHPAWAARVLKKTNPEKHIDISSTLHFSTIVSAFYPVDFYDYRPANLKLSNLHTNFADLLDLPFADNSVDSLSCMHTIEHVGLGRYGDPIDYDGDLKAIKELKRVLAINGNLLFVVPIGENPKIMFNAHRIYSFDQIMGYFNDLTLKDFSYIPDNAPITGVINNASKNDTKNNNYGCGCFWFVK